MRKKKAHPTLPEVIPFGMLIMPGEDASPLALKKTVIIGQVTGNLSSIAVTQYFTNPLVKPAELEYLFPLPHAAAVMDFSMQIGTRTIHSEILENAQARLEYEAALQRGQQAALLEERRPDLFALRLANIQPGEEIRSTIQYQETLPYRDGMYELVIPMGITPRYTSPSHPQEAKDVDVPVAAVNEPIGEVEINLAINAGTAIADPTSPSHSLALTRLDENRVQVSLGKAYIPDHDFVLRLPVAQGDIRFSSIISPHQQADVFYVSILPPLEQETDPSPAPREFIFVLDRSGSMSGEPIAQARNALKACLRVLNPHDTFSILLFDDELAWFKPQPAAVTQQEVDQADIFLSSVEGRGGTEIIPALRAALEMKNDETRTRYIVFLTDGAVSADERTLAALRRGLGNSRIFTFGIGPSVNRSLLQNLARVGRGSSEFLQLNEDIEGAILRFQDKVSNPVLANLSMKCEGGKIWDVYPSTLPDIFSGSPLVLIGRIKKTGKTIPRLVVYGSRAGQAVELSARLASLPAPEPAVLRAWARARIDDLQEQMDSGSGSVQKLRDEVISLALEHRLVTSYTSFSAVDSSIVNPDGKPVLLRVSQPLPEGLEREGFALAVMYSYAPPAASRTRVSMDQDDMSIEYAVNMIALPKEKEMFDRSMALRDYEVGDTAQLQKPVEALSAQAAARWLARSQNLDGSWQSGAEFTALALLFWVRSGFTTSKGPFRQQVRRTVHWLTSNDLSGLALFLAALALKELAAATSLSQHQQQALQMRSRLLQPASAVEDVISALLDNQPISVPVPPLITSLDDLRLARLAGSNNLAAPDLKAGQDEDLVILWDSLVS